MFVIVFYLFLILPYLNKVLNPDNVFIERDLAPFFLPPRYLYVGFLKSFELPLWNPYNYSGMPLLATLQPGIFYLPQILYLFLPFNIVWNWIIILHFVFAGFALYLFLRYLKVSRAASFIGGIIFMLSGYMLSVHNLLPHLLAVPWFPLVIMSFLKYFDTGKLKHLVYTSIFLAMEFFAGAPEIVMMTMLVLFVLLFFLDSFSDVNARSYLQRFKAILIVVILFLLITAVQLLPFLELKSQSIRSSGLNYFESTLWSFSWKDFIQFFLPDVFGYAQTKLKYWTNQSWLKTVYLGIIPFVLSIFFFISKDRRRWIFLVLMVISFIFALGGNTPVYHLLYRIPPFNSIRYPVKFLFLFFSVVAVVSAIGIDRLREGVEKKDVKTKSIIQTVFYTGFFFAALWGYLYLFDADVYIFLDSNGFKPPAYNEIWFNLHNMKRFLFFSFTFCVVLLAYFRLKPKKLFFYVILLLAVFDLFLANYGYYNTVSWQRYVSANTFTDHLLRGRETERYFITQKTTEEFEYFPNDKNIAGSPYVPLFGLYTIGGSEVMRIRHHEAFMQVVYRRKSLEDAKGLLSAAGVRYVTTSYEVTDKDFELLDKMEVNKKSVYLYKYRFSPVRFRLYHNVYYVNDDKAMIEKLSDSNTDLLRELVVLGKTIGVSSSRNKDPRGKVKLLSYKANRFDLEYEADSDTFLYVSDTYYPGWKVYVDRKETKIYRANLAFRAIEVPKGRHTVVFKYVPLSFYIGLVLTIIGILVCIWLWRKDKHGEKSAM